MSIQNEMPGYNEMNQYLNQQGTGLTPAEMHGLISGMICGGNDDSSWLPLLHDLTNEGMAFGHELAQALRKMHSATSDALQDDGFLFQLYLPDGDDVSVFDRADALAGWVNHFLLGLGVTQPKLDKVTGETGEAGTVIGADPKTGLIIACGKGAVRILEIQAPGGKRMKPEDYLRGHSIPVGTDLKEDRT